MSKTYHVHRFEDSSICDTQFQSSKAERTMSTVHLDLSTLHLAFPSIRANPSLIPTTEPYNQLQIPSPISKDAHISKIPQSAGHPHPPSHHNNPAHHDYPATIKPPNIPTLATLVSRSGNRYGDATSTRDESVQFAGQSDGGKRYGCAF